MKVKLVKDMLRDLYFKLITMTGTEVDMAIIKTTIELLREVVKYED